MSNTSVFHNRHDITKWFQTLFSTERKDNRLGEKSARANARTHKHTQYAKIYVQSYNVEHQYFSLTGGIQAGKF